MKVKFKVTNTTDSTVVLTENGEIIESLFLGKGESHRFSIELNSLDKHSKVIISNMEVSYDITEYLMKQKGIFEQKMLKWSPDGRHQELNTRNETISSNNHDTSDIQSLDKFSNQSDEYPPKINELKDIEFDL